MSLVCLEERNYLLLLDILLRPEALRKVVIAEALRFCVGDARLSDLGVNAQS